MTNAKAGIGKRQKQRYPNAAEVAFSSRLEAEGKLYFHQPKAFNLPDMETSYTPDFYVVEDRKFYEVVGTRQAFSYQREKLESFRRNYPDLEIEVVNMTAWRNGSGLARKKKIKPRYQPVFLNARTKKIIDSIGSPSEIQSLIIAQLSSGRFRSMLALSRYVGIGYFCIRGWLLGQYNPHPDHEQSLRDKLSESMSDGIPMTRLKGDPGENSQ